MSLLPSDATTQLLLLAFLVGVLLIVLLWRATTRKNPLHERLSAHYATTPVAQAKLLIAHGGQPLSPTLRRLSVIGFRLAGTTQDRRASERLLAQAGYRHPEAVGLLAAAKYSCGASLCLLTLAALGPSQWFSLAGLSAGLIALFVGNVLPELGVKLRAARRHEALSRSMPDALDLMVICAEAGLPFPRVLKTVSRELALSAPATADELAHTSAELQLLPDRSTALRHLAERTRVPAIESMVGSLIQAERYGTPLAQALRTIAQETRNRLILELEEKAGKLPAKLSVPLMTLILPPVVAIVATPALLRVIRSLMQ